MKLLSRKIIEKHLLLVIFVLIISFYGIFNARHMLFGPQIVMENPPQDTIYTNKKLLEIKGVAKNTVSLYINGNLIITDKKGQFEEELLLYPGFNIIRVYAKDRFGKETNKDIGLYYVIEDN